MVSKIKKLFSAASIIVFACSFFTPFLQASELEYVSSLLWSKAYDAKIIGARAYCAFLNGLVILDVSNTRKPALISRL
jgi:hypothetical protein